MRTKKRHPLNPHGPDWSAFPLHHAWLIVRVRKQWVPNNSMIVMNMEPGNRIMQKASGSRPWRTIQKPYYQRWRLMLNLVERNDRHKLELPRAWESPGSWGSRRVGEAESSHSFVSHGNKIVCKRNGAYQEWVGLPLYVGYIKWR